MQEKIKILGCMETSGARSGFGLYTRELFTRLAQNDRFELAELASFGTISDNKDIYANWLYYPAAVDSNDPRFQEYNSNPDNKHGAWRFERTCLDFKPHIVMDVRDPWNMFFQKKSPFRPFYHWVISPTVDSYPQQEDFIATFMDADAVFTYSDFGLETLRKQSNDKIKLKRAIYCGVDLNVFKPLDKLELRRKFGIEEDAFIIGTVMRNQVRKLYPELFKLFAQFLKRHKKHPLGQKTYLYVHTSFPDIGWDIGELLREHGISNRVIFTYLCRETNNTICSLYEGTKTYSPFSHGISARFPNVSSGLEPQQLAEVYNLFDLYIQYASNEGCGIPMLESSACGVPCAAINYSSMSDNLKLTEGIPLSHHLLYSIDTKAYRAVPDIEKNLDELGKYIFCTDKKYKEKKGRIARQAAEIHFNWDTNAKVWSDYFESVDLKGKLSWDSPNRVINRNFPDIPQNLTNPQFIKWAAENLAKKPSMAYDTIGMNSLRYLNDEVRVIGPSMMPFNRSNIYNDFKVYGENLIHCEDARTGAIQLHPQDFIEFAHNRK